MSLKGVMTTDKANKAFQGMDPDHYRYGIHDDGGQMTFIRAKYVLAEGADSDSPGFNPLDDMIPVSIEAFDFLADQWKSNQGLMRKLISLEHAFREKPADVLDELEKARKSFAAERTENPGATPV